MQKRAFAILFILGVLLSSFGCNDSATKRQASADTKAAGDAVDVEKPQVDKPAGEPKTTSEKPPPQDKSKAEKPLEDKERVVEHIVDYIVTYSEIGILSDNKLKPWAMHRFAAYDEPVELRVARSLILSFNFIERAADDPSVKAIVKARLEIERLLWKDETYIDNTYKVRRADLPRVGNLQAREIADRLEKDINDTTTPDRAENIAMMAAVVKSATNQEQLDARKKAKDRLRELVRNDPEIIKIFEAAIETADEMRKSRERVSELIKKAEKK